MTAFAAEPLASGAATEIRVRGRVQGVGFRPAVWRIATRLGLRGEVLNDSEGVLIRIDGDAVEARRLVERIRAECPPLARIDAIEMQPAFAHDLGQDFGDEFRIALSQRGAMRTEVAPDAATCPQCLAEIRDPFARRFRYAFANCTNCGPRLSIIRQAPYDRARTAMAPFVMCDDCRAEYEDPVDRRFHAEAIACHACGPRARLERAGGGAVEFSAFSMLDEVDAAAGLMLKGHTVAIKGLGGYHLACDATNAGAVQRLRARKKRYTKPFALMARDLDVVRRYACVSAQEEAALQSAPAPIMLLARKPGALLPEAVAPGLSTLGFMLPATPLHHLIFRRLDRPMVMTSGNLSDEPQAIEDDDARARLGAIADFFLTHDRAIAVRLDDSVARMIAGAPRLMRRARGHAPAPLALSGGLCGGPQTLALGAELKSTFCLVKDGQAIVSQHMGDLEDAVRLADFEHNVALLGALHEHRPAAVAVDMHPDYLSTKFGREFARARGLPIVEVQHHHAHIASCMAENGVGAREGPVLGIALDGLGLGEDGALWGGEFMLADYTGYRRVGTMKPVALPGGAQAVREPWRSTLAHILAEMGWPSFAMNFAGMPLYEFLRGKPVETIAAMIRAGVNSPAASSCGRLFDAVAAAIGLCREEALHEGEAAIRLESLVSAEGLAAIEEDLAYPFGIPRLKGSGLPYIEPLMMWQALLGDLHENVEPAVIAARFHKGLARAVAAMARKCAFDGDERLARRVALSGGVFQNRWLTEELKQRLEADGFEVLLQTQVPSNDGGLSLGQAAVAAARLGM